LPRAEQAAKIGLGIAARFHAITDRINRLGRLDRPALALVVLDDQREKIEAIHFRCARFWFVFEVPLDLFKGLVVFRFGTNWTDHFLRHDTVSGSMQSYSAWVPMNFTSTRPNSNDMWTINRYLLPPRSKMTRLSPTKSTVPPNCRFISAGLAQCALGAIANHARIGPSARGCRAQNSLSVRRAITCMVSPYHVAIMVTTNPRPVE